VVSYRLRVRIAVPKYEPSEAAAPSPRNAAAVKGQRAIWLDGTRMQASLYERAHLDVGAAIVGPAIIEQFDATTLIPPSWSGCVDGRGNLVLARQ
jgi:N-methylhydantoinase A